MTLLRHISRLGCITSVARPPGLAAAAVQIGTAPCRQMADIRVEKETDYAVMYMRRKPVNSNSKAFIEEMTGTILDLEKDDNMRGLILTSELPKVYSAGLDFAEFYHKPLDKICDFCETFLENWAVHYGSRLTTIAAINGTAVAGGAITALLCDYRIMARGPHTIGVIAAQRDLVLPYWLRDLMRETIGHREAEKAMQLGIAYRPYDALRIGMVDEVVEPGTLLDRARDEMNLWLKISEPTRATLKKMIRGPRTSELRAEDALLCAHEFNAEAVQSNIERFMRMKREKDMAKKKKNAMKA